MVVISLRMTMKVIQLVEQVIMEKYIYKVYLELIEIIIFAFVAKEDKIDCNITYEINFFFFFCNTIYIIVKHLLKLPHHPLKFYTTGWNPF